MAADCHQTLASWCAHRPGRPYRGGLYLPARLIWGQLYTDTGGVQAAVRKKLFLFLFLVFFHANPEEALKFVIWRRFLVWRDGPRCAAVTSNNAKCTQPRREDAECSPYRGTQAPGECEVRSGKSRHWGSLQGRSHQADHISKKPLQFRAGRSKEITEKEETLTGFGPP